MKLLIPLLAIIGLCLTVIPSILVFMGLLSIDWHKTLMLIGTVLWFLIAPLWFRKAGQKLS